MKKLNARNLRRMVQIDMNSLIELGKPTTTDYRLRWFWKDGSTGGMVTQKPIEELSWLVTSGYGRLTRVYVHSLSI